MHEARSQSQSVPLVISTSMEYRKWLHLFVKLLLWEVTTILSNLVSNVKLFVQTPLKYLSTRLKVWTQRLQEYLTINHDDEYYSGFGTEVMGLVDGKLSKEEVEMVMRRLGIRYVATQVDNNISEQMRVGEDELKELFEEDEPNLEEVKEAFDVFDEDKDGFIEAEDLQRVLWGLGLVKYSGISKCVSMIKAFDKNEDGMIDFNEFVNFMENC